jgi:hypothetical protein
MLVMWKITYRSCPIKLEECNIPQQVKYGTELIDVKKYISTSKSALKNLQLRFYKITAPLTLNRTWKLDHTEEN